MKIAFQKHLQRIRWRCHFNLLIEYLGQILALAGLIWALFIVVQRSLVLEDKPLLILSGLGVLVVVITVVMWYIKRPDAMQVALLIDERLSLRERFSTALAVQDREDSFARASIADAHKSAETLKVEGQFPVRPGRRWYFTAGTWIMAVLLFFFMPDLDLLGKLKAQDEQDKKAIEMAQVEADATKVIKAVSSAVEQLTDAELAAELGKFNNAFPEGLTPDEIRREAMQRMGDLAEKIKQSQSDKMDAAQMTRQMMRQLRGSPGELTRELIQAMSISDFGRAAQIMEDMQDAMEREDLSEEQRQELIEELNKLAEQIKKLAEEDEQLERDLEKLGLDKKLAQKDPEELRKVLEKTGFDKETLEELMRKAAASKSARSQLSRMGQALSGCCGGGMGGLSGDEFAEMLEALGEMDELQEDFYLTQEMLDQIAQCIGEYGQGWGSMGCYGEWMEGLNFEFGPGTGGPGRGWGARQSDDSGNTATLQTRTKTKTGEGPMIASWMFDGPQIKGESRRELEQLAETSETSVSEAISEGEIPRKYETTIKKYFGALKKKEK